MKSAFNLLLVIVAVCLFVFLIPSCSDEEKTMEVLENQGYTEIVITGWRPFAKSEKDWWSTGFEATAPNGKRITGAVSGGVFKGATIRFD